VSLTQCTVQIKSKPNSVLTINYLCLLLHSWYLSSEQPWTRVTKDEKVVKCSEVKQCSDGLSNMVYNIIRRHTDNMELLLICIVLLSHSFIFFRFYFLSMYIWFYSCLILQFMYFSVMSMYSYCTFMYLYRVSWHSSITLTEVFPCFFLNCEANARVKPAKMGHGPHSSKFLCCSMYCLCVNVYCTTANRRLPNCS
jgi:hypothetical protein